MRHHEYASLFPMMSEAEIATLAADIKANGQRQPIVTLFNEILDGRNRHAACEIAGVTPRFEAYQGDDALAFVISSNLHRRHLTESQRGMVASRLATMKAGGDRGNQYAKPPIGDLPKINGQTREDAAAALNVGTTTLDRARRVQKVGAPELVQAVESGEVKLGTAETLLALPKEEQREVVAAGPDRVRERAAELRNGAPSITPAQPKPERLPSYVPSDAPTIWAQARITMERIHPKDKHRVEVLNEALAYIQDRLAKNK